MLHRIRRWWKAHTILATLGVAALMAGAGIAAWAIYSTGATGTATGSFGTAPSGGSVIQITNGPGTVSVVPCTAGTGASCTGGTQGVIGYTATNENSVAETWGGTGYALATTGHPECDTHLFTTANPAGGLIAANGTQVGTVSFRADPTTPVTCSAAVIVATFTGTSTP